MSLSGLLAKIGDTKSFQVTLLYFLTCFSYHYHFITVDSLKCAYFTRPKQRYKVGFMRLMNFLVFSSLCFLGLHLHFLPASFWPPEPSSCPVSKPLFNNFKEIFSAKCRPVWSTDPHSWLITLLLSVKDLTWETGQKRVKLSCGEITLTNVVHLLNGGPLVVH